jgi:Na+/H+ antiporter NhaD/arsenite permease-like protein
VLIAPITILLAELLNLNPVPFLMAEAMLANTAGVATSIGDPASVLISSAAGFSFVDFLTHSLPVVAVSILVVLGLLRILFRQELKVAPVDPNAIFHLVAREALLDQRTVQRVLIILAGAVMLFFFQSQLRISSAFIALLAGATALAWLRPDDVRAVLGRIDLDVLLFFVGLFVMVGGVEAAGILETIANAIGRAGLGPVWLGIVIIWVVAIASALVDNIPITIAMIGVLQGMARAGIDVSVLWWAVAFGAGFGGNGTVIGSSASVVVVSLSRQTDTPITTALWTRRALPAMLASCAVTSIIFALAFSLLSQ